MKYYLAKTEPGVYSIDDLKRDKKTVWDGIKNAQALRAVRAMAPGDRVLIYHSGGVPGIAGLAKVEGEARPDPKDEKSAVVDLSYVAHIEPPLALSEIKDSHKFDDWALVRQSRLSTMEVPGAFVTWLGKQRPDVKL